MMRAFVHTAWATVLLFGTKGNTRASVSGTARLQSRFYLYKRNTIKDPLFVCTCARTLNIIHYEKAYFFISCCCSKFKCSNR